jgi:hypothetical protein
MANSLSMKTIAEVVETEGQRTFLHQQGCKRNSGLRSQQTTVSNTLEGAFMALTVMPQYSGSYTKGP